MTYLCLVTLSLFSLTHLSKSQTAFDGNWTDTTFNVGPSQIDEWYIYVEANETFHKPVPVGPVIEGDGTPTNYYIFTSDPVIRWKCMKRNFKCLKPSTVWIKWDYAYCVGLTYDFFQIYFNDNLKV